MVDIKLKKVKLETHNIKKQFIKNLSVLLGTRSLQIIINIYISILNCRLLSQTDFGKYGISISLANILLIPLVFGTNTTLLKVIPDTEKDKQGILAGTVSICNLGLCLLVTLLCLSISSLITLLLNISTTCWYLTILLAIIINWYMIIETFLKSQQHFLSIGVGKVVSSLFLLGLYILEIKFFNSYSLNMFLINNLIAQIVLILCVFWKVDSFRFRFDRNIAKKVFKIGFVYMLSWLLSTLLYNIDLYVLEVIVGKTNSAAAGIYQAYQVNIRNYFSIFYYDIIAAVLLPTIFNNRIDKKTIYKRTFKMLPVIGIVLFIGTCAVSYLLLAAYGGKYGFNASYIIMVSLGIAFQGIFFLMNSLLVLEGMNGAKLSLKVLGKPYLLLVAIIVVLTMQFGILGAFLSFVVNQLILMIYVLIIFRKKIKLEVKT